METKVLPIGINTHREAATMLGRAFQDNPVLVAIFQGLPTHERLKRITETFVAGLTACLRKGTPVMIKDRDRIVAAAVIYPPGRTPLPPVDQFLMLTNIIRNVGFYGIGRGLSYLSSVEKLHPKQPHYYLEYLGVEPANQGKGLGSALLKLLTDKANAEQMGCYLENANPRNNPLYEHFGFQITDEKDIIGVHNWFMWRPPEKNAA